MPKFVISKFFSIVIFLVMMVFFFFWITNQVSDLGLFFGFRTSHTVANDLAALITSLGGVPGNADKTYLIEPGSSETKQFKYRVIVSSKIVCVTSFLEDELKSTTDCATHPFDLEYHDITPASSGKLCIKITKTGNADDLKSGEEPMKVEGC